MPKEIPKPTPRGSAALLGDLECLKHLLKQGNQSGVQNSVALEFLTEHKNDPIDSELERKIQPIIANSESSFDKLNAIKALIIANPVGKKEEEEEKNLKRPRLG